MPAMVMHFMYVLLAWPDVKPLLAAAKLTANLAPGQLVFLQDFEFLCEYAIPQVRIHHM